MTATENVHLHEINKFGSMAELWWDTQGEFKTLHDINPLRLEFIERYAEISGKRFMITGPGFIITITRISSFTSNARISFYTRTINFTIT